MSDPRPSTLQLSGLGLGYFHATIDMAELQNNVFPSIDQGHIAALPHTADNANVTDLIPIYFELAGGICKPWYLSRGDAADTRERFSWLVPAPSQDGVAANRVPTLNQVGYKLQWRLVRVPKSVSRKLQQEGKPVPPTVFYLVPFGGESWRPINPHEGMTSSPAVHIVPQTRPPSAHSSTHQDQTITGPRRRRILSGVKDALKRVRRKPVLP